ncbi:MAG: succinate dehydrogenase, cytochrome b556 subunit [Burkholderiales bacterium]|nr:succinate dehydrogenase, cytochrome b556 subunit [Burkholderiales bacterium]
MSAADPKPTTVRDEWRGRTPRRGRNDRRAHAHASWWAFAVHRVSGIALAVFLPLHFLALSSALRGDAALDGFLRFTDRPLFKIAEWLLVVLLAVHLAGGVRLLLIEFRPWSGLRKDLIAVSGGAGLAVGLVFALALLK